MTKTPPDPVLVVDDEEPLARLVADYLTRDGFEATLAFDGPDAVRAAREGKPDVVVLDLRLPGLDGVEVCRPLRLFTDCYVIMLTGRTDEVDKLVGLSVGADGYLTKPFSARELLARVHAMLRRPRLTPAGETLGTPLRFGPLTVDIAAREVRLGGEVTELTRTEFDLLAALASRPKMVFTRRQLIEAVWGQDWVGDEHLVDVHIGHLRRKLGDDAETGRFIRTVRGVGYRMGDGRQALSGHFADGLGRRGAQPGARRRLDHLPAVTAAVGGEPAPRVLRPPGGPVARQRGQLTVH